MEKKSGVIMKKSSVKHVTEKTKKSGYVKKSSQRTIHHHLEEGCGVHNGFGVNLGIDFTLQGFLL